MNIDLNALSPALQVRGTRDFRRPADRRHAVRRVEAIRELKDVGRWCSATP
ncbi:MAG: hypothetical protein U5L46_12345 [Agrobacterium sp.]|nr:hypothetical protein [Agrobacterium sp.]